MLDLANIDPDAVPVILELIYDYTLQESLPMKSVATASKWRGAVNAAAPTPGWKGAATPLLTPTPAVPAGLRISIEQYFATAALIGILQGQHDGSDKQWAADWACDMADHMKRATQKRWGRS